MTLCMIMRLATENLGSNQFAEKEEAQVGVKKKLLEGGNDGSEYIYKGACVCMYMLLF